MIVELETKPIALRDICRNVRSSRDVTVDVPAGWGQGRATFGGLVAAVMFEKIPERIHENRTLRSILLSFVAPVVPGTMEISVNKLRSGKSATQVQVTVYQDEQICAVMLASFGNARQSAVAVNYEEAPPISNPDQVQEFPFIPGVTPDFTQHFDYRYAVGQIPFTGADESVVGGWIRSRQAETNPLTVAELLALLDAWPPAILSKLKQPAAGSTLTWSVSFFDLPDSKMADDWWQYEAHIQHAADGYSHIDASMWDDTGKVVAISRQTVSVFG
ncbi:acyl-CoA thioesterase II [Oleiphilus messinensis]|uniref:Acyl-CoA thioesterase II n=1 Tax=Oleiphilus messinensis TaxID=141451 RepID=A0A1Y0I6I1_9GAMM|nr:thioesterase family protein [Oleiphilus messinensis]ARU55396.1 acyl-CoA thioesterase II [Oleiphilus messinensis]